jgi:hypothetical protein
VVIRSRSSLLCGRIGDQHVNLIDVNDELSALARPYGVIGDGNRACRTGPYGITTSAANTSPKPAEAILDVRP